MDLDGRVSIWLQTVGTVELQRSRRDRKALCFSKLNSEKDRWTRIQSNNYISPEATRWPDWPRAARHMARQEAAQRGKDLCACRGIKEIKDDREEQPWAERDGTCLAQPRLYLWPQRGN